MNRNIWPWVVTFALLGLFVSTVANLVGIAAGA